MNQNRTYLREASEAGEDRLGPLESVLDLFQQDSGHTLGKKVISTVEDFIDILGTRVTCIAMAKAINTHRRYRVGVIHQFTDICESLIKQQEAWAEKQIEEFDAKMEKRSSSLGGEIIQYRCKLTKGKHPPIIFGLGDE